MTQRVHSRTAVRNHLTHRAGGGPPAANQRIANQGIANQGIALIGVLVAMVFLTALSATIAAKIISDTQVRGAYSQGLAGFYAAESGLNMGMGEFKTEFLNGGVPTGSDFDPRPSTIGNRSVAYQLAQNAGSPAQVTIPAGQLFSGLSSLQYSYTVTSAATNLTNSDAEATVGAQFLVGNIPLFQFLAFYTNDLEIEPGANMTLHGRLHTNGDLYMNAESGVTLAISDDQPDGIMTVQVTAKNSIHRGRKDNTESPSCNGTVNVDMLQDVVAPFNDLDPKTVNCVGSSSSALPVSTLAGWLGSMVEDIQSISVPQPSILSKPPQGTGDYWTNADLRIVLKLGVPGQLANPCGAANTSPWIPATIEVENADQTQDVTRTTLLHQFMASLKTTGTYLNGAPSSATGTLAGTRPIYYTDVPVNNYTITGGTACACSDANPICNNLNPSCYPQMNPANTAALDPVRGMGWTSSVNNATINRNGEAITAAQYDRTYTTNTFPNGMLGFGVIGACAPSLPAGIPTTPDLDYRRGGFYNWREKKWMYLLNVNIGDLLQWNRYQASASQLFAPGDSTNGGLVIYLSVVGPESANAANRYGVRIFGSANLYFPTIPGTNVDPTGITVVSDQAIYVQGNYNQGNVSPNPSTNLAKQPAAIMGDSLNVLSSAYFNNTAACANDCQSNLSLGNAARNAATTWINAAFLDNVDNTTSNNYNGGLENYPRFHEGWGGITLNYWGSFVSLGTPSHVNGAWCGTGGSVSGTTVSGCNIYNPPTRSYNYDPFFNNYANIPPMTPTFVYVQQVMFTEDFL